MRLSRFRPRRPQRQTLFAALSGFLLALARPGFDVGMLAFVALTPLFWVWRDRPPRNAAWLGFVAACAYYIVVVSWAWYFGAIALFPFVAVLALYWAGIGWVIARFARRGRTHPLLMASVWVLGEGLLARWPFGGFSWGEVGYAFHDFAPMRSLGALGGLPLISFVAVAINAAIVDAVFSDRRSWQQVAGRSGPVIGLVVLAGMWAVVIPEPPATGEFRFAMLQGNNINRDLTEEEFLRGTLPENHFALADTLEGQFDLIVFPESTFTDAPNAPSEKFSSFNWPRRLAELAVEHDSYVLANGTGDAPDGRALNLNVLWSPEGMKVGEYAKRHRVPYGEWVPWRSFLERVIDEVDQIPRDFAPGRTRGLFDIRDTRIATIICFESMFGAEIRPLVRDGAELIVVSTNNRSYRRSANSEQHLAAAQIRAVETGRPVLQAAISGISAVVEADGEVVARQPLLENGVVQGTIRARGGTTAYVRFGEWVLWGSGLVVLGSLLSRFRTRGFRTRGLLAGCLADRTSRSIDSGAV